MHILGNNLWTGGAKGLMVFDLTSMERVHQKTDKEASAQLAAALSQPGLRIVVCIEYILNFFAHI